DEWIIWAARFCARRRGGFTTEAQRALRVGVRMGYVRYSECRMWLGPAPREGSADGGCDIRNVECGLDPPPGMGGADGVCGIRKVECGWDPPPGMGGAEGICDIRNVECDLDLVGRVRMGD